jgi:hypothetical protein
MLYEGELAVASYGLRAEGNMPAIPERNKDFIRKRTISDTVPEGFQALWQTRAIMDKHLLRETSRKVSSPELFFDPLNFRSAPELPTAFLSNNTVLAARYIQSRYNSREFEAAMIEFEQTKYSITCISKKAVQIGTRSGQEVISGQQVDYKICGVIEAETDIPGIAHIVGLKVELVAVPGDPIFFFKASRVPEQVLDLMCKYGDQELDRRTMTWKSCDVTRVRMGLKTVLGLQSQQQASKNNVGFKASSAPSSKHNSRPLLAKADEERVEPGRIAATSRRSTRRRSTRPGVKILGSHM